MTKKDLLFKNMKCCIKNRLYSALLVRNLKCTKCEVIINDWENLKYKMEYIDSSYDDNLVLKSCQDIEIIDFCQGMTFEEIEHKLLLSEKEVGVNGEFI